MAKTLKHPNKGLKGVRNKILLRRLIKQEIVVKNIELFEQCFPGSKDEYKMSDIGNKVVMLFRKRLGYSHKTADCDVLWQCRIAYYRWKKGEKIDKFQIYR